MNARSKTCCVCEENGDTKSGATGLAGEPITVARVRQEKEDATSGGAVSSETPPTDLQKRGLRHQLLESQAASQGARQMLQHITVHAELGVDCLAQAGESLRRCMPHVSHVHRKRSRHGA